MRKKKQKHLDVALCCALHCIAIHALCHVCYHPHPITHCSYIGQPRQHSKPTQQRERERFRPPTHQLTFKTPFVFLFVLLMCTTMVHRLQRQRCPVHHQASASISQECHKSGSCYQQTYVWCVVYEEGALRLVRTRAFLTCVVCDFLHVGLVWCW